MVLFLWRGPPREEEPTSAGDLVAMRRGKAHGIGNHTAHHKGAARGKTGSLGRGPHGPDGLFGGRVSGPLPDPLLLALRTPTG